MVPACLQLTHRRAPLLLLRRMQVNELSESMTPAVNMLQLNGVAKKAVCLFKGA